MANSRYGNPSQSRTPPDPQDSAQRLWTLALDIAASGHDLNNLLAVAYGNLQLAMDSGQSGNADLRLCAQAMEQAIALLRELMHNETRGEVHGACDIPVLVQNVLLLSKPLWDQVPNLLITTEIQPMPLVAIPTLDLRRVLLNLIMNAIAAMPQGGHLTIKAWADRGKVSLVVSDTGQGMAQEMVQRVFEPFSSPGSQGVGLGIVGSRLLIERARGEIRIESAVGTGTSVILSLPQLQ